MEKKPIMMVSSSVYGIEELLERLFALLTAMGYQVWMSHKGTTPVDSQLSAFGNCLRAVNDCDLFFGIITPNYGSGQEEGGISITHREQRRAIEMNKPRWFLSHDHVVFARTLLRNLGYDTSEKRTALSLRNKAAIDDLRVIDMYEEAVLSDIPLKDRQGNWVQKFETDADALLFAVSQFSRFQEAETFVKENLFDTVAVLKKTSERRPPR
ncbi:MAG: DUF4062 domain-containing protein [Treponemataceae bacterium]